MIAEHAIALALAIAHGLDVFAVDTGNAQWSVAHGATTPMQSLDGKTLLVVGLGGIGTEVARRAHGLGMTVVATRDGDRNGPAFVSHVGAPAELAALAKRADVIVSCVPLTPATKGMFDANFFALLKPTAIFVNISRGGTMVMADLTQALNRQAPGGGGPGCRRSRAAAGRQSVVACAARAHHTAYLLALRPAWRRALDRGPRKHAPLRPRRAYAQCRGSGARILTIKECTCLH